MGGCRCSFRDCKVSTYKQPRMHFFHFPLKDFQRYSKWRQYAKTEEMLKYSPVKKKNMVVCARHFRPECFMNYKLDRLTRNAIPTLTRLSETQALDYELDMELGVLVKLEKPTLNHLVAPQNYECVLDLEADEDFFKNLEGGMEIECEIKNVRERTKTSRIQENELSNRENSEFNIKPPSKSSSNTVHILETIQVSGPHSKRSRDDATTTTSSVNNKQTDNVTYCPTYRQILVTDVVDTSPSTSQCIKNSPECQQNQLIDEENFIIEPVAFNDDSDDNDDKLFEKHTDAEAQDNFDANDPNATKLLHAQNEISSLIKRLSDAKVFEVKVSHLEKENLKLKEMLKENEDLKKKLVSIEKESAYFMNMAGDLVKSKSNLQRYIEKITEENEELKQPSLENDTLKAKLLSKEEKIAELNNLMATMKADTRNELKKQFELELKQQNNNNIKTQTRLQRRISTLEESLKLSRQQLLTTKNNFSTVKSNLNDLQLEKVNLSKQNMEIVQSLQTMQNNYETLDQEHKSLKSKYDCLQQKHSNLEQKYLKLETLQNQVAFVNTSLDNTPTSCPPPVTEQVSKPSANTLTKAQLFNSIKRYVSASMASLLRMEMFSGAEREWKTDERQVAVDLLRLGENIYKYFTDEWRLRLPALRDVRIWLSQSFEIDDDL